MYNDHVISKIMQEIKKQGNGRIYEITVSTMAAGKKR